MSTSENPNLKLQKKVKAQVIVNASGPEAASFTLENCSVYANSEDEKDIIFILRDENEGHMIQVTLIND